MSINFGMTCLPKSASVPAERLRQHGAVEDVDAHRRRAARRAPPALGPPEQRLQSTRSDASTSGSLGFSTKRVIRPSARDLHDAEAAGRLRPHRDGGDGDFRAGRHVLLEKRAEIHPVELVARQDEHQPVGVVREVHQVLPDGVGGALVPVDAVGRCCAARISTKPGEKWSNR